MARGPDGGEATWSPEPFSALGAGAQLGVELRLRSALGVYLQAGVQGARSVVPGDVHGGVTVLDQTLRLGTASAGAHGSLGRWHLSGGPSLGLGRGQGTSTFEQGDTQLTVPLTGRYSGAGAHAELMVGVFPLGGHTVGFQLQGTALYDTLAWTRCAALAMAVAPGVLR